MLTRQIKQRCMGEISEKITPESLSLYHTHTCTHTSTCHRFTHHTHTHIDTQNTHICTHTCTHTEGFGVFFGFLFLCFTFHTNGKPYLLLTKFFSHNKYIMELYIYIFHSLVDCCLMICSLAAAVFFLFPSILEIILYVMILFCHLVLNQFPMSLNTFCKYNFNDDVIVLNMSIS